jgi:hypothetical protein
MIKIQSLFTIKHTTRLSGMFLLLVLFIFTSCGKIILTSKGTHARELKIFEKNDKRIVFIGMTHLAKPSFFQEVKEQIDSLRENGYVFIKEGVRYDPDTSDEIKDTLKRKFRQLIGFSIGDYSDKKNKSLAKYFTNGDFIMQSDSLIGLRKTDSLVDMTYNKIIDLHEQVYGKIRLTDCDFQTEFLNSYDCKDGNAYKKSFYVVDIARTEYLMNSILEFNENKIAIVYGAGHFKWLYPDMLKAGFTYKNKKLSLK